MAVSEKVTKWCTLQGQVRVIRRQLVPDVDNAFSKVNKPKSKNDAGKGRINTVNSE